MRNSRGIIGLTALLVLSLPAYGIAGKTDKTLAIEAGAMPLTSGEIVKLLVGHTVTAKSGQKTFLFYYGNNNDLAGKLVGGAWSDSGYYGINDKDEVCMSISKDQGRLRCVSLLRQDGTVRKFDAQGRMTFEILKVETGNQL